MINTAMLNIKPNINTKYLTNQKTITKIKIEEVLEEIYLGRKGVE